MMISANSVFNNLTKVRENSPLIHNITNYVVMNNTANALLSIGASPVMAHATDEVEDMVGISSALVINMGTLDEPWLKSMLKAGLKAKELCKPVIFDPVGAGATPYRTAAAHKILKTCKPDVIRGNISEIMSLCDSNVTTKGVDSSSDAELSLKAIMGLAKSQKAIVAVSGKHDTITDGKDLITIKNGSEMMGKVTGMGCTSTALIAACIAVEDNKLLATANAMSIMSINGEISARESKGPASLQLNFIDNLCSIDYETIEENILL